MDNKPKLVLASDGRRTALFLDGVVLGCGIERLELSTTARDGAQRTTVHLLDIDVANAKFDTGQIALERMLDALAKE